jgi:hypothetical protein
MLGNYRVTAQLVASRVVPSSTELVSFGYLETKQIHPIIVKKVTSLCLINEEPCNDTVWGSGGTATPFLSSAKVEGEWSAQATPLLGK